VEASLATLPADPGRDGSGEQGPPLYSSTAPQAAASCQFVSD
jgi:hypothetical protein